VLTVVQESFKVVVSIKYPPPGQEFPDFGSADFILPVVANPSSTLLSILEFFHNYKNILL
jgi:hypothetical protein